jgi:multiple sugar transport system permease protein
MATTIAERPPLAQRMRRWESLPYWLVLPTLAYLALFFAWPMVNGFELAFREDGQWTLEHVRTMRNDLRFGEAFGFTMLLIAVIIPVQFVLALAMALLVNANLRLRGVFLYIFLLPLAISDLAAGIVWSAIFTETGYLNTILTRLGVIEFPYIWLNPLEKHQLLLAIVLAEIWRSTALITIILVAGLQGIPRDYGEAAEVFGASFFQRVRTVTLPMLKPSLQVALLLRVILAFEVFATVIAIAGASTTVLAAEAWRWQDSNQNANVAAAYAMLILVLSLVSAALIIRLFRTPKEQMIR